MSTIRWGIIGCGDVTEVKSGPAFQKATNSSLVAVMRRTGDLARDYAARHNVPKWYNNAAALINDPEVDAIYIATPPSSHLEYTLLSAKAGKPVYVEKPMALNFAECQAMIAACQSADVPLWVAYYRRMLPDFVKIKTLVDDLAIGQIHAVNIRLYKKPQVYNPHQLPWRICPEISGGGLFVDLGSHMLDFLDYVLGPITWVQGQAANQGRQYQAEDIVTGAFSFASGAVGTGLWWFNSPEEIDQIELLGTGGSLSFSCFNAAPISLTTPAGITQLAMDYPAHVHQPLVQTIVDELNGNGTCLSTGQTAARTSWVMDALLRGYYQS